MQLRPRHYVLIAVIVGLFVFNIVRHRQSRPAVTPGPAPIVMTSPPVQSPAWTAFDHAAALRDTPDHEFQPAMHDLQQKIAAVPAGQDMQGCLTWLEFYRQGALHPTLDSAWKLRSQHHLDGCVKFHLDTTAKRMTDADLTDLLRDCHDPVLRRNVVDAGLIRAATVTLDTEAPGAAIPGLPPRYVAKITLLAPGADEAANAQLVAQIENRLLGVQAISCVTVILLPALFPIL